MLSSTTSTQTYTKLPLRQFPLSPITLDPLLYFYHHQLRNHLITLLLLWQPQQAAFSFAASPSSTIVNIFEVRY